MKPCQRFVLPLVLAAVATWGILTGCYTSAPPSGTAGSGDTRSSTSNSSGVANTGEPANGATSAGEGVAASSWEGYLDVPYVSIMEDVDGLEIPRTQTTAETLEIKGKIPADVGNDHAKQNPGKPTTGDWLIIRFSAEPKSLNPIVETSAVQTYIGGHVGEALVRRDPETLEYEPLIAKKWVAEDSVKLSADYPGKERRIALGDGKPAGQLEIEYKAAAKKDEKDPILTFATSDASGGSIGGVWVGLFPVGKIVGAPVTGYHYWSNSEGKLEVGSIVPGKYRVRVGAELFGTATQNDDGSLTVAPATEQNPLNQELKSSGDPSITLAKDQWVDVQKGTIYTYYLRDDVKWSDGKPFTTKDLEFAYAVINNPFVDGESLRVYYHDLVEGVALDAHTFRMKYRQQYFMAFEFTAGLAAYAPPWHKFEEYFKADGLTLTLERLTPEQEQAQKKASVHGQRFGRFFNNDSRYNLSPLGTGPYIVDKWVKADRVELRRNPDYWNSERRGYLDRLIFKFIPDNVTALQALKSGEIDFLWGMTPEQFFEDLGGPPRWFQEKYVKASWYSPGFSYYGWNILKPLFQDRRVRIALSLLFDKREFLEKKLHNAGVTVSGSQYYFGPAYDHEVKPLDYSLDTARELLADAGWVDTDGDGILDKDGKKFQFELLLPQGNSAADDRAAVVKKSYKEAGIVMNIRHYEWASFLEKVQSRDFDAVNLGWATSLESDPYQIWHGSQAGADKRSSNHVSFKDPLADELIEQLRLTLDEEKRKRIHWSFHRLVDREQPYMFLYTSKDFGAYHRRFQGVKWYRLRPGFDLTEWYVPKEQQVH